MDSSTRAIGRQLTSVVVLPPFGPAPAVARPRYSIDPRLCIPLPSIQPPSAAVYRGMGAGLPRRRNLSGAASAGLELSALSLTNNATHRLQSAGGPRYRAGRGMKQLPPLPRPPRSAAAAAAITLAADSYAFAGAGKSN